MGMNKADIQKLLRKRSSAHKFWGGIIFFVFGLLLIAKLLNFELIVLQYIPERVLFWTAAIGSTLGGMYMWFWAITKRKLVL